MTDEGVVGPFSAELPRGEYVDAWVAYLDILGYRDLIRTSLQAGTVNWNIDRLRASVLVPKRVYEQTWGMQKLNSPTVRLLSDSVVVSAPTENCSCWWFVWTVNHLVASFVRHGLFLRGALAQGGHYDDGTILFSPALVDAYEAEASDAVHPRVIVPDGMRRAFLDENSVSTDANLAKLTEHLIWEDSDGKFFLNYLFRYMARVIGPAGSKSAKQYLLNHKDSVQAGLRAHREDQRVFSKYCWLMEYHNRFCQFALSEDELEGLLVPTDEYHPTQ